MNLDLLEKLCTIFSPCGEEIKMKNFLLSYFEQNLDQWSVHPEIIADESIQDCIALIFGKPRTAIYAHMDTIGFMVRYHNQLVPIGSPAIDPKTILRGTDRKGIIETGIRIDEDHRVYYTFPRSIETGTYLTYKPDFRRKGKYIQSPFLDNRIGIWNVLHLLPTIKNGIIFFTCGEENGDGSAGYLARLMYENYQVQNALVSDVTWASDGIIPGDGVVISLKDRYLPRRSFVQHIIEVARKKGIRFQLEVEDDGSSDGGELQRSPFPINWCFIGPAGHHIHSPEEKISILDLEEMNDLYRILMDEL